jgi:hypothetical protein
MEFEAPGGELMRLGLVLLSSREKLGISNFGFGS